jgi:hypothetical protein
MLALVQIPSGKGIFVMQEAWWIYSSMKPDGFTHRRSLIFFALVLGRSYKLGILYMHTSTSKSPENMNNTTYLHPSPSGQHQGSPKCQQYHSTKRRMVRTYPGQKHRKVLRLYKNKHLQCKVRYISCQKQFKEPYLPVLLGPWQMWQWMQQQKSGWRMPRMAYAYLKSWDEKLRTSRHIIDVYNSKVTRLTTNQCLCKI